MVSLQSKLKMLSPLWMTLLSRHIQERAVIFNSWCPQTGSVSCILSISTVDWCSVKGGHHQLRGEKNPFLSRVAVLTWALRSRILIFAILESHKLKGWWGYPWPCCPELCRWWCVGLQPEQATRGSFLQQPRVGARPPNSHALVRFACVKHELQENPSCCWTLRVCSLVFWVWSNRMIPWKRSRFCSG